jgi:hypothetical protein
MSGSESATPAFNFDAPLRFYAAILDIEGEYTVEEFDTLDALVARIKSLVNQDVSVFSFCGTQLKISKPPARHLMTPWGNKPLFDINDALEVDEKGYLGADPIYLHEPPQISVPTAKQKQPENADEFFDDGDNVLGVFDSVLPDPDA